MYAKCIGECMQGDSAGSNPRFNMSFFLKEKFIRIYNISMLFLSRSSRQKSIA